MMFFSFCLFFIQAGAQTKEPKKEKDKVLANKVYVIELTDQTGKKSAPPVPDEITFRANKVSSKIMLVENQFPAAEYTVSVDSSSAEKVITFEANSINPTSEEELKWEGTVTGEEIEGTAQWIKKGKVKGYYYFTGTLKAKKKK